jgi:hypothetical protein
VLLSDARNGGSVLLSVTGSNGITNFTDAIFDAQGNFFFYGFSV